MSNGQVIIPVSPGRYVEIQLPSRGLLFGGPDYALTETEWQRLLLVLDTMHPGIVRPEAAPVVLTKAEHDEHDAGGFGS